MRDYVDTDDDNGGVHINSGIPNHAFYLAAHASSAATPGSGPGEIWYDALTGRDACRPTPTSRRFAERHRRGRASAYGHDSEEPTPCAAAWSAVGSRRPEA